MPKASRCGGLARQKPLDHADPAASDRFVMGGCLRDNPQRGWGHSLGDLIGGSHSTFAALTGELCKRDADVHPLALFLGQTTPDAVRLTGPDGVVRAVDADVTLCAHCLCSPISAQSCQTTFILWMEEQLWIRFPASADFLPVPNRVRGHL
jgi:hypothetical protein